MLHHHRMLRHLLHRCHRCEHRVQLQESPHQPDKLSQKHASLRVEGTLANGSVEKIWQRPPRGSQAKRCPRGCGIGHMRGENTMLTMSLTRGHLVGEGNVQGKHRTNMTAKLIEQHACGSDPRVPKQRPMRERGSGSTTVVREVKMNLKQSASR